MLHIAYRIVTYCFPAFIYKIFPPFPLSVQEMLTGQRLCQSSSHNDAVLAALNQQRSDGILCDITLIAEEQKFHAHKAVLAACSDYFRVSLKIIFLFLIVILKITLNVGGRMVICIMLNKIKSNLYKIHDNFIEYYNFITYGHTHGRKEKQIETFKLSESAINMELSQIILVINGQKALLKSKQLDLCFVRIWQKVATYYIPDSNHLEKSKG